MRRLTCTKALTLLPRQHKPQFISLLQLPAKIKVVTMLQLSFSLTSLLILLELLLPQISAGLGGMSSPNDGIPGARALESQAQSLVKSSVDSGLVGHNEQQSGAQLEPRQGVKSAECNVYPMTKHWTAIVEIHNWDPDKDVKAQVFEKTLGVKLGKGNFNGFWWKKFPPDTMFKFHVPYSPEDGLKGDMKTLISDAIYEYSGNAKIRTTCYHG